MFSANVFFIVSFNILYLDYGFLTGDTPGLAAVGAAVAGAAGATGIVYVASTLLIGPSISLNM
jgi:hypothetical protein